MLSLKEIAALDAIKLAWGDGPYDFSFEDKIQFIEVKFGIDLDAISEAEAAKSTRELLELRFDIISGYHYIKCSSNEDFAFLLYCVKYNNKGVENEKK